MTKGVSKAFDVNMTQGASKVNGVNKANGTNISHGVSITHGTNAAYHIINRHLFSPKHIFL